jgi:hypothetical protein
MGLACPPNIDCFQPYSGVRTPQSSSSTIPANGSKRTKLSNPGSYFPIPKHGGGQNQLGGRKKQGIYGGPTSSP